MLFEFGQCQVRLVFNGLANVRLNGVPLGRALPGGGRSRFVLLPSLLFDATHPGLTDLKACGDGPRAVPGITGSEHLPAELLRVSHGQPPC